jgi:ATP-dependent helicase/nuclease subunit A
MSYARRGVEDPVLRDEDAAARRRCCERLEGALVLEAGAGTGKTAVLVARVLAWCLGRGWQREVDRRGATALDNDPEAVAAGVLEGVVAFTFTERAAGEMAERVGEWLGELASGRLPAPLQVFDELVELPAAEPRAARARALLACIERLSIGTIHGYCRRLLARFPLAAKRHPGRDEIDGEGRLTAAVVEHVLGAALPQLFGDPGDADAQALAADGAGPAELASALEELIAEGVPLEALEGDPFPAAAVDAHVRQLEAQLTTLAELLAPALVGKRGRRLQRANQALAEAQLLAEEIGQVQDAESLAAAAAAAEESALLDRLRLWGAGRLGLSEQEAFGASADELVTLAASLAPRLRHLGRLRVQRLRQALRVLPPLLKASLDELARRGISTFGALVTDALGLLQSDEAVRRGCRREIQQLLVDEFQDTDPAQCEIVRLLALQGATEQRPGLLIVGDPKQSIYGWRGADLAAYEAFVGGVRGEGGEQLRLSLNFRSVSPILDEVDRVFEAAMRPSPGLQPPFARLLPTRVGDAAAVEYWVVPSEQQGLGAGEGERGERQPDEARRPRPRRDQAEEPISARRAREIEAAALVRDLIERQGANELRWGDVALLQRTTTHQEIYLRALRRAGIPYLVERDRSYFRRREVIDAAALLRTVLEPGDPVALLTLLRSSVSGVPDAALMPLWRAGLPELADRLGDDEAATEWRRIDELLAAVVVPEVPGLSRVAAWPAAARATLGAIAALRRGRSTMPLDRWLDALRATLPLEVGECARFLGAHRLANLERFFERAQQMLADEGQVDGAELPVSLRRDIGGGREEQEAPVGDETLDAVRVLTIHRAKGLTFEQVYLLGTHGVPRGREGDRSEWVALGGRFEGRLLGAPSLGYERLQERRAQVQQAEEVRALYVAMTRPRQRLVVGGRFSAEGDAPAGSHAALIAGRPGAERELGAVALGGERERDGVRWRALATESHGPQPQVRVASTHVDSAGMSAELALLGQQREAARARQQRPLTSAVAASALEQTPAGELMSADVLDEVDNGAIAAAAWDGDLEAELEADPEAKLEADLAGLPTDQEPLAARRRAIARAVGSAVHATLEQLDLDLPLPPQLQAWSKAPERLLKDLPRDHLSEAREELELWLSHLEGSRLLRELAALRGHLLGREVPLVLRPEHDDRATGALVGSVDALLRDPVAGELVVVDFKTDRVGAAMASRRAERYRGQLERYAAGIARAMGAARPPRAELWFLWADTRVVL